MSEQMVEPQGSNKCLAPYSHHIPVHLMATQTSEIKSFFLQKAVSGGTESVTYLSLGQPTPFPGGGNWRCDFDGYPRALPADNFKTNYP